MRHRTNFITTIVAAGWALSTAASAQVGGTGASVTTANSYAASQAKGELTMAALQAMPREVPAFSVPLKAQSARFFAGKKRIYLPSYALMITRSGEASAYSGGGLTSDAARRSTIQTTMSGISDELGARLAGEALTDLKQRLTAAGYEVLTAAPADAPAPLGPTAKSPTGQTVYGPPDAPLYPGMPWVNTRLGAFDPVVGRGNKNGDDLIVLLPGMGIDYERMQSSGSHVYGSSAEVGTQLRFHIMERSGAMVDLHSPQPYNAAWPSYLRRKGAGTDEPFAVLTQTGDKSDSRALHAGLALMGVASRFNQKKIYEAQADPERFAALTRAAFQGMNAALVAEIKAAK